MRKSLAFRAAGLLSRPTRQVLKALVHEGTVLTFDTVYNATRDYDQNFVGEVLEIAGAMGLLLIDDSLELYTEEVLIFNEEFIADFRQWRPSVNTAVSLWVSSK